MRDNKKAGKGMPIRLRCQGRRLARLLRRGLCLALAMALSGFCGGTGTFPAYAEESSVIESLSVSFKSTYGEAEEILEPEITVKGTGCSMGDVQYRTEYDKWKPGKKVRVEITVYADDGKYFPTTINRSKCKVSGAEYVSAKALDNTTLQVKVDYKPVSVLGDTEKAGWSSSKKRATWKSVDNAPGYSLVLYGDDKVVKRLTVETNSVNLTEYMDDIDKTYYYEVKAIPITSEQKKYLKEGQFVTSSDQEFDWDDYQETTSSGGPSSSSSGSGTSAVPSASGPRNIWKMTDGKWSYYDGAGNKIRNGWFSHGGYWYYLDQGGIMSTGWVNVNGTWYYTGEDGKMQTGWIQPSPGSWYYLGQDGSMQTGWLQVGGKTYYMDGSGVMAANTVIDGRQLGADGAVVQ